MIGIEGPAEKHAAVLHVRPGRPARGHLPGHKARGKAGAGFRGVILRSEGKRQPMQPGPEPLGVAPEEQHAVRAVLPPDRQQPVRDLPVGFLPGDLLKFPLAASAHPLQRRQNPVLPVDILPVGQPLGAEQPVVHGMPVDSLHLYDPAVLHIGVDAAVKRGAADRAQCPLNLNSRFRAWNFRSQQLFPGLHVPQPPISQ